MNEKLKNDIILITSLVKQQFETLYENIKDDTNFQEKYPDIYLLYYTIIPELINLLNQVNSNLILKGEDEFNDSLDRLKLYIDYITEIPREIPYKLSLTKSYNHTTQLDPVSDILYYMVIGYLNYIDTLKEIYEEEPETEI